MVFVITSIMAKEKLYNGKLFYKGLNHDCIYIYVWCNV